MSRKHKHPVLVSPHDPRVAPAYTFAEAAHYLRLPVDTLRNWALGHGSFKPVFHMDDPVRRHLSFWNVVEAHVLSGIRRRYGVQLPLVRTALDYVKRNLATQRPLINQAFQTDGGSLFVERYGKLIDAGKDSQIVMGDLLLAQLERIERDAAGLPILLYPFTRASEGHEISAQPKLITINPAVSFGRPSVKGIPTSVLWSRYRAGDSVDHLADDYDLTRDDIEEAIRCEAA